MSDITEQTFVDLMAEAKAICLENEVEIESLETEHDRIHRVHEIVSNVFKANGYNFESAAEAVGAEINLP